ncbi:MAG: RnfABCDGE type electron transport complex subunit C, partial [Butyrivibrio sp.]|nr:RnfABCDGE type electron transport complex subunit C [Butyrivibrio sp.]
NAKGILAIEDNKPDCIQKFRELTKDDDKIMVKALQTKYPEGAERMLIYACTKREINSSMLPADAGCIVDNVDTLCAVYRAVTEGRPLMERIVTITGDAVVDPRNYKVRIGTNYRELLEDAGGFSRTPAKIISGGPMMGFALFDLDVPTTKTASALTCLTEDEVSALEPSACINCAKCVEVCPERLIPKNLADAVEHGQDERFLAEYGMECCECGCCSFICPARRQLTQLIKGMRKIQLANRKK